MLKVAGLDLAKLLKIVAAVCGLYLLSWIVSLIVWEMVNDYDLLGCLLFGDGIDGGPCTYPGVSLFKSLWSIAWISLLVGIASYVGHFWTRSSPKKDKKLSSFRYTKKAGKFVLLVIVLAVSFGFFLEARHGNEVFDFDLAAEIELSLIENVMYGYVLLSALLLQILIPVFLVVSIVELIRYIKSRKA